MNILVYPEVVAALAGDPEALQAANGMDPSAGECMRRGLEAMMQLIGNGYINLEKCNEISDNYTQVILRFFEGDVPMMICTGDTVSGTGKRESQSEAFSKAPFTSIISCPFRCRKTEGILWTARPWNTRSIKPVTIWI